MDGLRKFWYYPAMTVVMIPSWQLYGEITAFPDVLHIEQIVDRAAGLDWTIGAHRHLHLHQLFLLSSGTIDLTLDGEAVSVVPPSVINIPRGTVHGFSFSAGTEGCVLTLPADDFPDLFAAPAETAAALARAFSLAADPSLQQRFAAVAAAHGGTSAFRRTLLRAEAAALIAQVTEKEYESLETRTTADPRIQRFDAMVRNSVTRRFSLQDLAGALAMSPRSLSRLCKTETGMSAQRYFEAQKMREACRLLVYTRMPAQQIAYQLGFDDPSYFSRVFRRNLGVSPNSYRRRFDR
jgi:AraC family transcriptional regulator, transcriptional activator of pobA